MEILDKINNLLNENAPFDIANMRRKAPTFNDAPPVKAKDIKDLNKLKTYTDKDIYGGAMSKTDSPAAEDFLNAPNEQWFILKTKHGKYLIGIEGYQYARYIAKIK